MTGSNGSAPNNSSLSPVSPVRLARLSIASIGSRATGQTRPPRLVRATAIRPVASTNPSSAGQRLYLIRPQKAENSSTPRIIILSNQQREQITQTVPPSTSATSSGVTGAFEPTRRSCRDEILQRTIQDMITNNNSHLLRANSIHPNLRY